MSLETQFGGKTALITGAGKGIGRALAVRLSGYGAKVYALARDQNDLTSLKDECPTVEPICVDLMDWDATRKALSQIEPIDILINNAGFGGMQPFLQVTSDVFDQVIGVNLKASVNVSQVVAEKLIEAGKGGSIVNITSMAGKRTLANYSVFCSAKAGSDMLAKGMAVELGQHKIKVNSISLGCVSTPTFQKFVEACGGQGNIDQILAQVKSRTPMTGSDDHPIIPMDDVINTILFMSSDLCGMMSGENIVLDGGFCAT
ncbi:unnamed protein product [Orchesella dallaii]|uniref:L-xylulose reductase n=1 Tax=Orchesella dallaii TaxID=48710 RepID=A0ABP1PL12_9HEXA